MLLRIGCPCKLGINIGLETTICRPISILHKLVKNCEPRNVTDYPLFISSYDNLL